MSKQRRIDLLFAATVRVMAAARLARAGAPGLAMALLAAVAVHGTLSGPDPFASATGAASAARPVGWHPRSATLDPSESAAPTPAVLAVAVREALGPSAAVEAADDARRAAAEAASRAAAEPPAGAARKAPSLDREQQNVAHFIASRYRVTLETTTEFVHHAYKAARDTKLDPLLVLAVMSVESSFNPTAQSSAGAQGLMQVLTRVHTEKFLPFGGVPAAFDPVANIRVGSMILKEYLQREGTVEGALKAYVGAALAEHDGGYGLKVLGARERIAAAAAGQPIPAEPRARQVPVAVPAPLAAVASPPSAQPVSMVVETRSPEPAPPHGALGLGDQPALDGRSLDAAAPAAHAPPVPGAGDI
jgi:soluble lytic murein transglycosylase-like protein